MGLGAAGLSHALSGGGHGLKLWTSRPPRYSPRDRTEPGKGVGELHLQPVPKSGRIREAAEPRPTEEGAGSSRGSHLCLPRCPSVRLLLSWLEALSGQTAPLLLSWARSFLLRERVWEPAMGA